MEAETQVGRDIAVGHLLVRQHDVEPDRIGIDIVRAPVCRLHDRRPTAGAYHELAPPLAIERHRARLAGKLARFVVIDAVGLEPLGDRALRLRLGGGDQHIGLRGIGNTR